MEFKQFILLLWRWAWLLLLGLLLGAAGGILYSRLQTPVYQATAKVLVMRVPDTSTTGLAYLGDQQLAKTFSDIITTQPVFDSVSSKLGFKVYSSQISISQDTNSQIIKVVAEDSNPQRVALIANTQVELAIKRYVDLQVGQYTSMENDVQTQLNLLQKRMTSLQSQITTTSDTIVNDQADQIQSQMASLQDEISQLQQDIASLTPATTADQKSQLAQKQARLDLIKPLLSTYQTSYSNLIVLNTPMGTGSADENYLTLLRNQLGVYQKNYVDLMSKLELLQQSYASGISNVTKIQDASAPARPVRPQILMNTLLTSVVGLLLALVTVLILNNMGIALRLPRKKQ
jgi:succinoglycan biosynthesis transport protein ExoP